LCSLPLDQTLRQHQSVFDREALRKRIIDYPPAQQFEELKLHPDDLEVLAQYDGSSV